MKKLIGKNDFVEATNLRKFQIEKVAGLLMELTKINKINKLYDKISEHQGIDFVNAFLDSQQIRAVIDEQELHHIPKTGAFVTVSNHPYGTIDGLLLIKTIVAIRPEFKVMANFLLKRIDPIGDYFVAVNPFESHQHVSSSFTGIKTTLSLLRGGTPIGIFPAGEVSSYQPNIGRIADREWHSSAIRLILRAGVPIIPIYFEGSNSKIFHLVGRIHPLLRTASLPRELFNKKKAEIRIRIGKPITIKEQQAFGTDFETFGRYLRAKTYSLGSALQVKSFFKNPIKSRTTKKNIQPLAEPIATELLTQEITNLPPKQRLHAQAEFELYIADASQIPKTLNEIGRLRELTFRAVGEGTNLSRDIDEYDLYYHHLILWDKEAKIVAGAYRLGKGKDILEKYGKKGFYTQSLFEMKDEMLPVLEQTIELGRSFILKTYQQKRLPLFLLWKGILYFLMQNSEYRYLLGPVSISNDYSEVSKSMIVAFIKKYYYNHEMATLVRPRKGFKPKLETIDAEILLETAQNDLVKFDKIISDIEMAHFNMPILLKKYIKQNAKIISFNIDPKFNDALDGLMILDLEEVPKEMIDNLKKEMNFE
ncbi:MAG: lysophospholipid acyltransferase family protein [Bernardetiaceae bacterium]|nr:lysophospholipid acyltransferase family protein [Bernardetiaceae bacterium]